MLKYSCTCRTVFGLQETEDRARDQAVTTVLLNIRTVAVLFAGAEGWGQGQRPGRRDSLTECRIVSDEYPTSSMQNTSQTDNYCMRFEE